MGIFSVIVPSGNVFGPIGAEVAWLVALKSLPCLMGYSYLARLTGN